MTDTSIVELLQALVDRSEHQCTLTPTELAELSLLFSNVEVTKKMKLPPEFETVDAQIDSVLAIVNKEHNAVGAQAIVMLCNIAPALEAGFISLDDLPTVQVTVKAGVIGIQPVQHVN